MISTVFITRGGWPYWAALLFCLSAGSHALAQEPTENARQRLLDRPPFDRILLKQSDDTKSLDVLPLDLPQRPLAVVPASGKIKVRLLDRPAEEFELSWSQVAQVHVFEQLLLLEARRLTADGQFDEAFDYFARLTAEFPELPGLDKSINDYLRRNALALYQSQQHDRSLAVLLTLYERDPKFAGLSAAVERVAAEIIQRYLREGDYAAARNVLVLWQTQFRGLAAEAAAEWRGRFEAAATRQANEATQLIHQKNYIAARKAVAKAVAIWPELDAAASVSAQIQREFPFVTVGVLEVAPREPLQRIDSWPALRAGRLAQRLLSEQVDFGAEGGVYRSPFGELIVDESGRQLDLKLDASGRAAGMTADGVARQLLSRATPGRPFYRVDFTTLLSGVAIGPPNTVQLHLSRIHVRPEALLQIPPKANAIGFSIADFSPEQVVFAAPAPASEEPDKLQAIVERTMPDDETAVAALLSGEVDVLDRVPPWHLERLRAVRGIQVDSYRLPTVHALIPNARSPLVARREFRRALCFGIDRRWIVERALLGGASAAGFEVISGPFPAGTSLSDPVRYGYNNQIAPRPFEPRLAAILATVAWSNVQTANEAESSEGKENEEESQQPASTEMPRLTLAHAVDPVARLACQSIQAQLQRQGISVQLKEFTTDELLAGELDYDLRYAELAVWEPLTDARLLVGPGSLTSGVESSYLNVALRKLDDASNWNDVRALLADVHEIAHHDLPVIPLWQTINYFAYRTSVRGIGESPVVLYQNVEEWSAAPAGKVARIDQGAR